jgi:cell surface protein SprA
MCHHSLSFKADVFRQFGATRPRNVGGGPYKIPETYDKYYTFDRFFILQWNLTRSINLDFAATNNARVDEPSGRIDTEEKKDSGSQESSQWRDGPLSMRTRLQYRTMYRCKRSRR